MKKLKLLMIIGLFTYSFTPIIANNLKELDKTGNYLMAGILVGAGLIQLGRYSKPNLGDKSLHTAVKNNDFERVQSFLNKGLDINMRNELNGETPLHAAVKTNNPQMVNFLLKAGANPDIKNKESIPLPLLGSPKAIEEAPLHYAVEKHNLEIAKMLLNHGATIDIPNHRGYTALHLAVEENDPEMVNFLLDAGADQYIRNNPGFFGFYGSTPLQLAEENSKINPEIIKRLKRDTWFSWLW